LGGKAGGLNGVVEPTASDLSGLGEPISLSASIAAATPVIIAAVKILKDTGLLKKHEPETKESIEKEAQDSANESTAPSIPSNPSNTSNTLPSSTTSSSVSESSSLPTITTQTTPSGESKGVMAFVKKNPAVVAIGAGVVLVGGYMLLKPKKAKRTLGGVKAKKSRKRKSTKRKSSIKKVTLK
jgi:hypothetical protein